MRLGKSNCDDIGRTETQLEAYGTDGGCGGRVACINRCGTSGGQEACLDATRAACGQEKCACGIAKANCGHPFYGNCIVME